MLLSYFSNLSNSHLIHFSCTDLQSVSAGGVSGCRENEVDILRQRG